MRFMHCSNTTQDNQEILEIITAYARKVEVWWVLENAIEFQKHIAEPILFEQLSA